MPFDDLVIGLSISAISLVVFFLISVTILLIKKNKRETTIFENNSSDDHKSEPEIANHDMSEHKRDKLYEISDRISIIIRNSSDKTNLIIINYAKEHYGEMVKAHLEKLIQDLRYVTIYLKNRDKKETDSLGDLDITSSQYVPKDMLIDLSESDCEKYATVDAKKTMDILQEVEP